MSRKPCEAHVFVMAPEARTEPFLLTRCRGWLSSEELARCARLRRAADRQHFLLAHALLRHSLSRYTGRAPGAWRFEGGPHGRPELVEEPHAQALRFNLSHTRGLVACIVSYQSECGIDVEHLGRRLDPLRLARRFFAAGEVASLEAATTPNQSRLFYQLWTLKEAYLKARGLGLAHGLAHAAFYADASGTFRLHAGDAPMDAWHFETWQIDCCHQLSVAIRRAPVQPCRVRLFRANLAEKPKPPQGGRLA